MTKIVARKNDSTGLLKWPSIAILIFTAAGLCMYIASQHRERSIQTTVVNDTIQFHITYWNGDTEVAWVVDTERIWLNENGCIQVSGGPSTVACGVRKIKIINKDHGNNK